MGALFSALAFLTLIPIPFALQSKRENGMFVAYPVAGLLIGALLAALYYAATLLFPGGVAAVILIAGTLGLTGAIHIDGLADCADAFYGRRDRETTLRILKDPRIGTMGGVAIAVSLLARYAAASTLPVTVMILSVPLAMAFSRSAVIGALQFLPYVRTSGGILSSAPVRSAGMKAAGLCALLVIGGLLPIPTAVSLCALGLFWHASWKRIQGCTGDVLGASIEIAEIVFLLVMAAAGGRAWSIGLLAPLASQVGWGL